ncbi:MAG: M14 family metallopeptidase, partial [Candidatus Kariarchaeaceae archaeon]
MAIDNLPLADEFEFKYYLHGEIKSLLEGLDQKYPNLIKIEEIGKTYENRQMWCSVLTNFETGSALEKPAYYIDANIHAGEVTGSTVALYTTYYLCEMYGKEAAITNLMDNFVFYIIPRISADGSERYLPHPEKLPGFHREDINNDGEILMMRMKDSLGDWKISEKDPRLMLKRQPDDFGNTQFYRLFPEGMLYEWEKGDPIKIAPIPEGLDLNRNNPSGPWAQEFKQGGAGPFPLSEPETRAIADFLRAHPNICGIQSFHTFSGAILRPYSFQADEEMETKDLEIFQAIGKVGERLTGYPCININKEFKYEPKVDLLGGYLDWVFEHLGIFSFSTELWDMIKEAGIEERDFIKFLMYERTEEEDLLMLKWNDDVLEGKGFKNWESYEHLQLGTVEIGGWKTKFTFQNPPIGKGYLEKICHSNAQFAFAQGLMSPRIRINNHSTEKLADDNWKITLSVINEGFLATYVSTQAQQRNAVKDNELRIELGEGCELVSPLQKKIKFDHLEGRSNKLRNSFFAPFSPEDQKWNYEFV